jgi:hypothetical protein
MLAASVASLALFTMLRSRRNRALRRGAFSEEYRAIHEAVRLDPESVWDRLRALLCSEADHYERLDLVEDLMFWHPDAYIARLETLAEECPGIRDLIVMAEVGGRAVTPGLARFHALQGRLDGSATDSRTTYRAEGPWGA